MMRVVRLSQEHRQEWDRIALVSNEGWFFHRYDWVQMVQRIWDLEPQSFLIEHEGKPIAICPLQLRLPSKSLRSQYMGTGGPALLNDLPPGVRKKALKLIYRHIHSVALQYESPFIEIALSPLSPASLHNERSINPLIHHFYEDTSTHTWMADLTPSQDVIMQRYADDARRSIKKAQDAGYTITPVTGLDGVDRYYDIHCHTVQRTGIQPHPKSYFIEIFEQFCRAGLAVIWEAKTAQGETAAFEITALFKEGALYWMGCSKTEHLDAGVNYLLQHHAMMWAKSQGARFFENGEAFPNVKEGKLRGLSGFKGKFGGELHRYFKGAIRLRPSTPASPLRQWGRATLELLKPFLKEDGVEVAERILKTAYRPLAHLGRLKRRWTGVAYLSPSWGAREWTTVLKPEAAHEDRVEELRRTFKRTFGISGDVFPMSSGRAALELALRVIKEKHPDQNKFIVTAYGCRGIFDPLINAGFKPLFADINDDLSLCGHSVSRLLHDHHDVAGILIPHLCGRFVPNHQLIASLRQRGLVIIDDLCQSLGARMDGQRVIAPHDMAIFSFGLGKNLSATAGGLLVSNLWNDDLASKYAGLDQEPEAIARRRFRKIIRRHGLHFQTDLTAEILSSHQYRRISSLDATLIMTQLGRMDEMIARQTAHARCVISALNRMKTPVCLQPDEGHVYSKLSVIFKQEEDRLHFVRVLNNAGIETEEMYTPLHMREFAGECAPFKLVNAEQIYRRVINIPVRPNLSRRQLAALLEAINRADAARD